MPIPTATLVGIAIEASEALCALDLNKAQSIDCISPQLLKSCAAALTTLLHHLFQLTLNNHILPMEWQIHSITPYLSQGIHRPISLLCSTSKALERIIHNKCIDFVSSKISTNQFGFLANRSCLQQLFILVGNAYKEMAGISTVYHLHGLSKGFWRCSPYRIVDKIMGSK